MSKGYSKDEIIAAARRQGRTEEQIQRMLDIMPQLIQKGLLKTARDGVQISAKGKTTLKFVRKAGY